MKIEQTNISGPLLISPKIWEDDRGYFYEGFNEASLLEHAGISFKIKQLNFSKSSKNVLRGLHFQTPPKQQSKLICCLDGEILDVAVDIRYDSPTFGKAVSFVLSGKSKQRFYIPAGFAHGFLVLSDTAEIMYAVDENYSPAHDTGIYYNDPSIGIEWGVAHDKLILSSKDQNLPLLQATDHKFPYYG